MVSHVTTRHCVTFLDIDQEFMGFVSFVKDESEFEIMLAL